MTGHRYAKNEINHILIIQWHPTQCYYNLVTTLTEDGHTISSTAQCLGSLHEAYHMALTLYEVIAVIVCCYYIYCH